MRAETKNQVIKFAAFAALGIIILLMINEFRENDRGNIGGSVNEVVEEIEDEIDDHTVGR
jgi:hypothetical protein